MKLSEFPPTDGAPLASIISINVSSSPSLLLEELEVLVDDVLVDDVLDVDVMEANGYRMAGPNREVFLEGPDLERLEESVIEMQFPVEKVAA